MESKSVGAPKIGLNIADRVEELKGKIDEAKELEKKKIQNPGDYDVQLSPQAREMAGARAKAQKIAQDTSPIREDRVQELKQIIERGEYKVDSEKIADGMLKEAIRDRVAEV